MTAKSTAARVAELRARRQAAGLVRLELYAHPENHQAIKALAEKLQKRRDNRDKNRDIDTRSDTVSDGFLSDLDPVKAA
jgi:hypothetical protein